MLNGKKILVTGGAGYIGSHTVFSLIDADWEVLVVDNLSTGSAESLPKDIEFIFGDVGNRNFIADILSNHQPEAVMHFAGSVGASESVTEPLKYYRNNTEVSRQLIECCVDANVNNFIFSSTAAVYGNSNEFSVSEMSDTNPINPYGLSKLMTERILEDVAALSNLRYIALRYFNVAGADSEGRNGQRSKNATHLIKTACEVAVGKRDQISIYGDDYDTPDGTCIRDYVHVSDVATAHVAAIDHLVHNRENLVLNCGYGNGISVREVLDTLQSICNTPLRIDLADRRSGDAVSLVSDNKKILETLNWGPRYDNINEIIETALKWEKKLSAVG